MKIVVIGNAGRIESKLAEELTGHGHDIVPAPLRIGISATIGEGLKKILSGADIVVDVATSPSVEDSAALEFSHISGRNLLAAEVAVGVRHHVALSIVGADRLSECEYFRAKLAQENQIRASKIPYTILRTTQLFESVAGIVDAACDEQIVRMSPALLQPVALEDVVATLVDISLAAPTNGVVELAGPERISVDEFARKYLNSRKDPRRVVADVHARLFGVELDDRSLTPGGAPRLGSVAFERWLSLSTRDTR